MTPSEINYKPFLNALDNIGFCTFQLFEDEIIEQLQKLYKERISLTSVNGLYANHNTLTADQSIAISNKIRDILFPTIQTVFPNFNYFLGHFVVKGAHSSNEFSLHQDWNIVDEAVDTSYQLWIPLQLTYPKNGGMFVVPGSHTFFNNYRSGSYGIHFFERDTISEYVSSDLVIPAGNVLVFNSALLHGSFPNPTDEDRVAIIVNIVEKKAQTFYFHKNELNQTTDLFSITGHSLIQNLKELEKGIIPENFPFEKSIPLCSVDNSKLSNQLLAEKYKARFSNIQGSQVKQLPILKDKKLEQEVIKNGYAIIDLLNPTQVDFLNQLFIKYFGNIDQSPGRFTTLQYTDITTRKEIHNLLENYLKEINDNLFYDYQLVVAIYYVKKAFTSGDIDLHADSTLLLNHQLESHYGIWTPLLDVDQNNGTFIVIPKSHLVKNTFFNGKIDCYHDQHKAWLKEKEIPLKIKAGQAVLFDNNLLHNSTPNHTALNRICITYRITHQLSQYYSIANADITKKSFSIYEEKKDFFLHDDWDGEKNTSSSIHRGTLKDSFSQVSIETLKQLIEK